MSNQKAGVPLAQQVFAEVSEGARGEEEEMSKENTENTVQDSSTRHVVRQIQKHMQDINKLLDLLGRCSASGPFKRNGLSREQSIGAVRSYKKGRTV